MILQISNKIKGKNKAGHFNHCPSNQWVLASNVSAFFLAFFDFERRSNE